ncbi:MAG: flagellar export protein FliJ [Firmicutes bacterium]|nr:flagellar export protein FliJ [Bacillota bacterium]
MSFKFKFQPILNLRKHHEDQCRTRFKEEQIKLWRIEEELATLQTVKKQREAETEQLSVGVISLEHLLSSSKYLAYLRRKQDETNARRVCQENEVEQARTVLVQARKETKVMEKLKEKRARAEAEERLREEQKTLDEIAITQIYRN